MPLDLTGSVAAITGGAAGLGAAMGHCFAAAGAAIAVLDIAEAAAERTATAITVAHGVATTAYRVDVADAASTSRAAAHVAAALGGCDILCANVGVQQFGSIDRLTDDDWRFVLDVNVLGTVRTVGAFLPLLRARDGFRRIVLTASLSVLAPAVRMAAYQTSKFAVAGFGETLRHELAPEGIGVSVLFPGGMVTGHLQSSADARPPALRSTGARDDDLVAMLAHRPVAADDVVTPEHAIRHLLRDLEADEPYIVTHGAIRDAYTERHGWMIDAIDRSEGPDGEDAPMTQDTEALVAIEAITRLKARYFRLMDTKRWEEWGEVFSADVHLEVPEADLVLDGRAAVVSTVSSALAGAVTTHHGHMPEIEITGPDTARGVWAMSDMVEWPAGDHGGRAGIQGSGHYHEEYVREGGQWRIAALRLERLRVDPLT